MRGKLWVWAVLLLVVAEILPIVSLVPKSRAVTNSIWGGTAVISDDENISETDRFRATCEYENLSQIMYKYSGVTGTGGDLRFDPLSTLAPVTKEECVVQNRLGIFGGTLWSPTGNPADALEISGAVVTAVPASNVVLFSSTFGSDPYGSFRTSINYNLPAIGRLDAGSIGTGANRKAFKRWTVTSRALNLAYSNNSPMLFRRWEFSRNGKYAIGALTSGLLIRLNLETRELQPVAQMPASTAWALAISNDGNYVVSRGANTSSLNFHDLTGCQNKYSFGNYPATGMSTAGCTNKSILSTITAKYPDSATASIFNFQFALNSASFSVDAHWGTDNRRRITFAPENYTSQAQGYLAMGDSYTSGEGDTQGGTWYESGTDEQGDKTTFAGRNLCHLSRRSYPYLMAVELGYLGNNLGTPPADGTFHSVACSGAKIHNIIGAIGEKQDDGDSNAFAITDNQYRYDDRFKMAVYQVGAAKQEQFLEDYTTPDDKNRVGLQPEIITLGIGGNDVGFADFLKACLSINTCDHAKAGSKKGLQLVSTIAQNKARLVSTYKQLKQSAPEARIYVHGYPKFVEESGGYCGLNVHLDDQERLFTSKATEYMNSVVKSAAQEAGVFYVDVEDIFSGRMLCSDVDASEIVVNGATAGNDIDLGEGAIVFDVQLGQGICIRNCLGNESYHPTPEGFKLYKNAILAQTNRLQADMPIAENSPIPVPDIFFGNTAVDTVTGMNNNNSYAGTTLALNDNLITGFNYSTKKINLSIQSLMPSSSVEIVVESTPTSLGTFTTDANGNLNINDLQLPADLEAGYHEIHVLGRDVFTNSVDYRESFVLTEILGDFDGDGVEDATDSCPTVVNSLIDVDLDGVDDACDTSIVMPVVVEDIPEEPIILPPEEPIVEDVVVDETPPEEVIVEEPQDDEFAEYVDKGIPSPETVAGNEDIVPTQQVLGASTNTSQQTLASTGVALFIPVTTGFGLILLTSTLKRKIRHAYRLKR